MARLDDIRAHCEEWRRAVDTGVAYSMPANMHSVEHLLSLIDAMRPVVDAAKKMHKLVEESVGSGSIDDNDIDECMNDICITVDALKEVERGE
jgi:hypothetical protein